MGTAPKYHMVSGNNHSRQQLTVANLADFAELAAKLLSAIERRDGLATLRDFIAGCCGIDNFIVYVFDGTNSPQLMATSVPEVRLVGQMTDFVAGLFLLDPFVLAADRGRSGFLQLREITPEGFFESEFYQHHYRFTDVHDEARFLVPVDHRRMAHVFVERETRSPLFDAAEIATLAAVAPLVKGFVEAHLRWLERVTTERVGSRQAIDLGAAISGMGDGCLTDRERQVVECMLKGHSAKSTAHLLAIEEGTVTNHKRNIYAKLDVHSAAQLFDLFLRKLS